ncbi:MAG: undecaprenyl/decaprenyl-phosphate alpha-N-acetylglucosaminyl 1-phosphate transferase [Candidatus Caldatribacterium sp.]|nr:undecaprenyl/decaprenyl-phosphate alpha-N-acetylglucosaminyl 1-phosphate transferase [Candidatus Caldatribacterium sp.]
MLREALFFPFLAFLLSLGLVPLVIRFSERRGCFDLPDGERKIHDRPISRLGGLAVFGAFLLSFIFLAFALSLPLSPFFLLGVGVIFATGLLDDFLSLPPWEKFAGQCLGACFLLLGGVVIRFFTLPWSHVVYLGWFGYPLTLFWIVGISNALNLIDGLDGLSGGVGAIAGFTLGIIALQEGRVEPALFSFLLVGAVLGFLPYNFPPARIFLGDGGALFLGGMLAAISVQGAVKSAAAFTLVLPAIILGVPIFDTLFAIVRRKKNRLPISSPDRGHLHHRLLERGYSKREVLTIFYGLSGLCGGIAIFVNTFLANSTYSLLLFFLVVLFFLSLGRNLKVTELPKEKKPLVRH